MNPDYSKNPVPYTKSLKQRIMRRIYFIFMVRNFSPFVFDCFLVIAAAFIVTLFVSVKDVLLNLTTAQNSGNLSNFSFSAFSGTELETKILLVVLGVIGFFLVRHLKQAVRAVRTLRENTNRQEISSKQ